MKKNADELREQLEFMREKLATMRVELKDEPTVIEYDHGGGQSGTRKNPAFETYNALMRTYNSTITSLRELEGSDAQDLPQRGKLLKFEKKYGKTG